MADEVLYGAWRGELPGLRWADIGLEAGTLPIGRPRVLAAGQIHEKAPKSKRGYRTLPLDGALQAALGAPLGRQRAEPGATRSRGCIPGGRLRDGDRTGRPFTRLVHCRVSPRGSPGCRVFACTGRHTTNSLMAAAGTPDHIQAAWCGHTAAGNVATYTHGPRISPWRGTHSARSTTFAARCTRQVSQGRILA